MALQLPPLPELQGGQAHAAHALAAQVLQGALFVQPAAQFQPVDVLASDAQHRELVGLAVDAGADAWAVQCFDQAFGQKASSESVFTIRILLRMLLRPIPLLVLTSRRSAV